VTEGLNRIHDYTPADMTVTVEAGTTFDDLQTLLARDGQWLPLEPPLPAATTVGGLLAADLAGPLAASEGRVRDYVIGMRMVTAAGVAARAGGRVVKNVAGYDLMKLFIGSLGTLTVLTEATFKVRPLPERQHGLVLAVRGMRAALELGAAIDGALAVFVEGGLGDRDGRASVVVRLGGVAADVAVVRARLLDVARREGAVIEVDGDADAPTVRARFATGRDFPAATEGELVVRLATLPARLSAVAAAAIAALDPTTGRWLADPRRGVLTLALATGAAPALLAALTQVADAHGAHLVVERFPSELASTITVWHPLPPALPLMRRMKAALDPGGVLAPGRFVGRL
jgi:glycolate oxidase FAD binding subunit